MFFSDFQELQKVDKTGSPLLLTRFFFLFPTAVMDVQILGDEDAKVFLSLPVDQDAATIWLFGKAYAPAEVSYLCPAPY